jgi:hypothetical protein
MKFFSCKITGHYISIFLTTKHIMGNGFPFWNRKVRREYDEKQKLDENFMWTGKCIGNSMFHPIT